MKMVRSMFHGEAGYADAEMKLELTCECPDENKKKWVIKIKTIKGEGWAVVAKNAVRFRPLQRQKTTEYVPYLGGAIAGTVAHEKLHIKHFKEYYNNIKRKAGLLNDPDPWDSKELCKYAALAALDIYRSDWKLGRRSEINHSHEDFANYQLTPLSDRINARKKGWIYTSADFIGGHKKRKPDNSFSYVD